MQVFPIAAMAKDQQNTKISRFPTRLADSGWRNITGVTDLDQSTSAAELSD